jgi:cytochrome c oxidase subunit 2
VKANFKRLINLVGGAAALMTSTGAAMASGMSPWQLGFQASVSEVMDSIHAFNNMTLILITVITLFVLALLVIVMVRYNAKANPNPSRTSHNTMIEVIWTVVPILILVVIAVPSFRLLYKQIEIPEYDMTIKATGNQWYWGYEYTDEGMEDISFDASMVGDSSDLAADKAVRQEFADEHGLTLADVPRLLAADYQVVVPVDKTVRVQVTASNVLHAFAVPAFGIKIDAVPGRLNETWFKARETGIYYGQCSELCGKDHAFMPIAVRVVTQEQYDAWVEAAKDDIDVANEQLMAAIAQERKTASVSSDEMEIAAR